MPILQSFPSPLITGLPSPHSSLLLTRTYGGTPLSRSLSLFQDGGGFYGGGGGGGGGGGQFDQDGGGFYGGEGGANAGASQGGGSQGNSQTSGQDKRATRTLVPLTIKQIINATQDHPDDDFKVDGHEVAQVRELRRLRSARRSRCR